ncbi:MAG: HD domain-containing protein [Acidimicrobiales bacterium]
MPGADVYAAIDIGTNSFHLLVARMSPNRRFEILAAEKEMVRLGSGAKDMKELQPEAMDRGVACLRRFKQVAEAYDPAVRTKAVATSAVREAANQDVFLARARAEAGVEVEVVSGVEEARLIHLGVRQAVAVGERQVLVVDIGGGSTEFVIARGGQVIEARSLKVGAIRLTERFFPDGRSSAKRVERCRQHIRSFLAADAVDYRAIGHDLAVGSSGTIGNLAEMIDGLRRGDAAPAKSINGFRFTRDELEKAVQHLVDVETPEERLRAVPGLDAHRADIIVGGALLLEGAFEAFGIEAMTVSSFALREGLLMDQLQEYHGDALHHLSDLRRASVDQLAELFDDHREHSAHVTELALQIFRQTQLLHGLDESAVDYLEAAGLLHNVGRFVAHSAHHRHSYYLIRNTEHLTGFTNREIELIALVARYHRKSEPRLKHPEFALLSEADQRIVCVLAGILRVAIGLDRSHSQLVERVRCRLDLERRRLVIEAEVAPGGDASLDLYTAGERRALLEESLGVTVELADPRPAFPLPS